MLYFRHDDWSILCAPLIERLTTETFIKLEEVGYLWLPVYSFLTDFKNEVAEILKMRKLGFSFVRLLPKETGVRPIVNLSRRRPLFRVRTIDILLLISH